MITMTLEDFTTLANWAEMYGLSRGHSQYVSIRDMIEKVEHQNGVVRQFLYVRWRDREAPFVSPPNTSDWPPQLTLQLVRYTTPWRKDEVMAAIMETTPHPFSVEVTQDRTGTVGWTDIDLYFG